MRVFDLFQHSLQPIFKFAAVFRTRKHRAQIKRNHALVLQNFWHIARDDALRKSFHDCGFTNARFADQYRIIFGTSR